MTPARHLACATALAAAACSGPEPGSEQVVAPPFATFRPAGDMMLGRCGSLDCHGHPARNLTLWGKDGQRLDPGNLPGEDATTVAEYLASYRSIVGLEPEILGRVFREGGARPERLTLVRKARRTESHKGKRISREGDDIDVCMVSWLGGNVDTGACERATLPLD